MLCEPLRPSVRYVPNLVRTVSGGSGGGVIGEWGRERREERDSGNAYGGSSGERDGWREKIKEKERKNRSGILKVCYTIHIGEA